MAAIRGARERARSEITAAIKEEARRQLAAEGAARLSLRAVARELGMVSSALYRYFPSRDELLTALIVDAYDALGAAAERAAEDAGPGAPAERWLAVCRAVRAWALAHPHEYTLLYGSPVPGYAAPETTNVPAGRAAIALLRAVGEAHAAGTLREPPAGSVPEAVLRDTGPLGEQLGLGLPAAVLAHAVEAWSQLFGLVSFEIFGQFNRMIEARPEFFDHAAARLGEGMGLPGPERRTARA
ncbi:TetR/AcrR family transcriptional regulator [Streptomyces sp. F63]|uniref:TetR/AcrR family transcriptional regulator n=1 Tax=Streptomyces sp. F63 TaxID=2824887 RepID=UPI001B389A68|nr:TetR/AcrR family transcriptional regulator [Streptomyces sp. F63]MBQ0985736.1 TetR/AcrR family transcriptional regulator [Streptomyces sp. F63]